MKSFDILAVVRLLLMLAPFPRDILPAGVVEPRCGAWRRQAWMGQIVRFEEAKLLRAGL